MASTLQSTSASLDHGGLCVYIYITMVGCRVYVCVCGEGGVCVAVCGGVCGWGCNKCPRATVLIMGSEEFTSCTHLCFCSGVYISDIDVLEHIFL